MHPLKNLNVWGDGGVIVTDRRDLHDKLVLLRNHGLVGRNLCEIFSYNSRLDTLQAIVAINMMGDRLDNITQKRIDNAELFDRLLVDVSQVTIPPRPNNAKQVFHLYVVRAERRDELLNFLISHGIDAKVHYPVPMHLQPAAAKFGYQEGDYPVAENICKSVISFPVHEYISPTQVEHVSQKVREFYAN